MLKLDTNSGFHELFLKLKRQLEKYHIIKDNWGLRITQKQIS